MKLAVISDLHLGRRDRAERFGHDDAEFLRFLDFLEGAFERIVLLGDVWETLTSPRPRAHAAELAAARRDHPEIARRFAAPPYAYVHGNHDLVAARVDGAPSELRIDADGVRMLFTHGHVFDRVVRHARHASEAAVWLGSWTARLGRLAWLEAARSRIHVDGHTPHGHFQQVAVAHARRHAADVVVTGHTHRAVCVEHGDRLFLNSGSCAEGRFSYVAMDTRAGRYSLHTAW